MILGANSISKTSEPRCDVKLMTQSKFNTKEWRERKNSIVYTFFGNFVLGNGSRMCVCMCVCVGVSSSVCGAGADVSGHWPLSHGRRTTNNIRLSTVPTKCPTIVLFVTRRRSVAENAPYGARAALRSPETDDEF